MDKMLHAQITEILDTVNDMTIATLRPDGFPQATVVAFVHDDIRLYFSTDATSQKARNIAACDKVSLTVTRPYRTWDEIEGLSIGGHATLVTDPEEAERAGDLIFARFPQVADLVAEEAPDSALFRVDPVVISVLDYAKGFGHTEMVDVQARLAAIS